MGQRGTAIYFWPVLFSQPPQGQQFRCHCHHQRAPSSLHQSERQTDNRKQHHYDKATQTYWRSTRHTVSPCIRYFRCNMCWRHVLYSKSGGSLPVWAGWSGECWYLMMSWGEWEKKETEAHREGVKGGQRRVKYHVIIVRFKAADYWLRSGTHRRGNTPTLTCSQFIAGNHKILVTNKWKQQRRNLQSGSKHSSVIFFCHEKKWACNVANN